MLKNYGFVEPTIQKDHYVFGGENVPKKVIVPDGQWLVYKPENEKQFNAYFDTFGCTVFGSLNMGIEILSRYLLKKECNKSDRFTYIVSGTFPPGNDPHVVAEAIREYGVVEEKNLPFSSDILTLDDYRKFDGREDTLKAEALEWKKTYKFLHEWIFENDVPLATKQALMMECLTYSPLGVSGVAWQRRENGLYYKLPGQRDNHWFGVIGYVKGVKWIIFDTYPDDGESYIKELEWDYDFGYAKRYYLDFQPTESKPVKVGLWQKFINWLLNIIKK